MKRKMKKKIGLQFDFLYILYLLQMFYSISSQLGRVWKAWTKVFSGNVP